MAISKSTPYVRYKKDFTSNLHLGTIHIESEYLDRTQKTTIESIHGMTWHNKVVNENKELNLLSDTQLELTELEKQYWNTGEKRVSVDEIHTLEEVEPNEDGTYTYTVNSMEGEYIEIYDGINNITSTSDGLDGQFEIVYDTTEEDINGNIALDNIVSQYEITDSGVGVITGAKSTGLTLVNNITESSKEEVVAIEQQKGQYFTIDNTVQGNIKSAILKGNTLVNCINQKDFTPIYATRVETDNGYVYTQNGYNNSTRIDLNYTLNPLLSNDKYYLISFRLKINKQRALDIVTDGTGYEGYSVRFSENTDIFIKAKIKFASNGTRLRIYMRCVNDLDYTDDTFEIRELMLIEYQEGMENWDIPYFEGMQSVKMPVLNTTGKNLMPINSVIPKLWSDNILNHKICDLKLKPNTSYTFSNKFDGVSNTIRTRIYDDNNTVLSEVWGNQYRTFTTNTSENYWVLAYDFGNGNIIDDIQIEEGTLKTTYEPYKSNILTVNEEVELRGFGDVQDELNLETGELTQRIKEVILDGDENWTYNPNGLTNTYDYYYSTNKKNHDYITVIPKVKMEEDKFGIVTTLYSNNSVAIRIEKDKLSSLSFNQWLSQNPITIQYQLGTPVIKTVDLTVQNQDGSTIPHIQTQQGITHVSTSSDGLTPVVEMSCSYDTIIKPNTTYTIKLDRPIVSDTMYLQVDLGGTMMMLDADVNAFTIKTPSTLSHSQLRLSGTGNTVKEIIVLEGNRVNDKIEYFEGMKNVENPILVVSNCQYVFGKGGRK